MKPCASISFHGASNRFGPIRLNTSPSLPSSRTSVAVRPSRRRACSSAVSLNTGRGQQVHLVVDDEAPVHGVEQRQVGVLALPLRGEDLVGGDGDRPHLLDLTGVFADLLLGEGGAPQQFAAPLPRRDGVGDQHERVGLGDRHGAGTDQRLARAAGQHDHAGAAGEEVVHRVHLVGAQVPGAFVEGDRMRRARRVAGEVLRGPAQLDQLLLQLTSCPRFDGAGAVRQGAGDQRSDAFGPALFPSARRDRWNAG